MDSDEIKGRAKQAAGDLTNDDGLKAEGKKDETAGKVKDKVGDVGDAIGDGVDKIKDKLNR